MIKVPRQEFVPLAYRSAAYSNTPLPIGHGQTISQPLIVALMTELLQLARTDRVLAMAEFMDGKPTIQRFNRSGRKTNCAGAKAISGHDRQSIRT